MIKVGDLVNAHPLVIKKYKSLSSLKWPFTVVRIEKCNLCDLNGATCPGRVNGQCFGFTDENFVLFKDNGGWDAEENS